MIREWSYLIAWLHEARQDILLQQKISENAGEWQRRRHPNDRLYRGFQLKEAQAWARRNTVSSQEQAFLKASAARHLRSLLIVVGVILFVVTSSGIAGWYAFFQPQPTLVTTQQDDEIGSLRWCMNNAPLGSTIRFAQNVRKLIKLTGDLVVGRGKQLTIVGPGANQLTISGGNLNVHIHVFKGATLRISGLSFKNSETVVESFLDNEGSLTITNSVISNNKTTGDNFSVGFFISPSVGGGVTNRGTLNVTDSIISYNSVTTGWGGGIFNSGTLILTRSIVSNNTDDDTTDDIRGGGGILNNGTLTLINSTVSYNKSLMSIDGGIANTIKSTLTLINSTVSYNRAIGSSSRNDGNNGGIGNDGILKLINSTVSHNKADRSYGGIGNDSTLTLINSTISNNAALNGSGGGIGNFPSINDSGDGTLTLTNSTISSNTASTYGGGILNLAKTVSLMNSTVSGNTALNGNGGGIENFGGIVTLTFCTLYDNHASTGGGLSTEDDNTYSYYGTSTILNSLIAGNQASQGPDVAGKLITKGYNLIQNTKGSVILDPDHKHLPDFFNIPGSQINVDPHLQLNGSTTTQTHALLPGSLAIDAIPRAACLVTVNGVTISTDQRGITRPQGSACDIGAYEYRS